MFNKDFYPTPNEVIETMLFGTVIDKSSIVLDPSAGKGNILDYVKLNTNRLYAYEIESDLRNILSDKEYITLGDDFLEANSEDISHITHIIMNPPFSKDVEHILHAYEIAPQGCEIIALCNYESLSNSYCVNRVRLNNIIKNYGRSSDLGKVFMDAERTTNVNIGLIKLYKPVTSSDFDYDMFYFNQDDDKTYDNGLMSYNEVTSIVNRYVGIVKEFNKFHASLVRINDDSKTLGVSQLKMSLKHKDEFTSKEHYLKELQKNAWQSIFNKLNINKYMTKGVVDKLNKFIETQENIPFTEKNVYVMLDIIFQTRQQSLNEALCEIVDYYTRHTDENIYLVEGWKTNLGHMLNKKIIIPYGVERSLTRDDSYSMSNDTWKRLEDLQKVICNITGENYDDLKRVYDWVIGYNPNSGNFNQSRPNTWYETEFFEFKFYKKRTIHLKFKNLDTWKLLNATYGKIKGCDLPMSTFK